MKYFRWILFILFFISLTDLFSKEIITVISTGIGPDKESARQNALRNAVEQVAGVHMIADTYVRNLKTIQDNIYTEAEGYIKSYKELDSYLDKHNLYNLTLSVQVIKTDLLKDLQKMKIISEKLEFPRILIVPQINEESEKNKNLLKKCYQGLAEVLTNRGYFIIDQEVMKEFFSEQKNAAFAELNNRVADYGLKVNADYLIRYNYYYETENNSIYCDLEVISSSNGKVVFSTDNALEIQSKSKIKGMIASRRLGETLGIKVSEKLKDIWKSYIADGRYFTLIIEGFANYNKIILFEQKLKKAYFITQVSEIESGDNKVTTLIKYQEDRKQLKKTILDLMKSLGWTTRLLRSENNRMMVKILD